MDILFQPTTLGPLTLKNHIVRSATNEHLSEPDGWLTQVWADTLIELAQNEVGLIISGHFCVDASQRADEGQPVLNADTSEALLRCTADGVHRVMAASSSFSSVTAASRPWSASMSSHRSARRSSPCRSLTLWSMLSRSQRSAVRTAG